MGFIRGSLFVIVSVLLFLSLFGAGFFYMVSLSLDYDVLKENLVNSSDVAVREMGVYDELFLVFPMMDLYCLNNSAFNFDSGYGVFDIPCEIVAKGIDEVFYYALGEFVMGSYYNDYNCSLLECWEETKNPSFLISDKTRNYTENKFYFLIFASFVLIGLVFLLIEKKSNLPFVVGGLLVVVSLPFMKLDSALSFIGDKMIVGFVSIFLTQTYSVFLKFMFLGVFVLVIGIIWKLFLIGFKVNKFVGWVKNKIEERKKKKIEKLKGLKKNLGLKKNIKGEVGLKE